MKLTLRRDRYQRGSLTTEKRSNGPDVWVYRWREAVHNGQSVQRKRMVGTRKEFPTEASAWKAVDGLRLDINSTTVNTGELTVDELIPSTSPSSLLIPTARPPAPRMFTGISSWSSSRHDGVRSGWRKLSLWQSKSG